MQKPQCIRAMWWSVHSGILNEMLELTQTCKLKIFLIFQFASCFKLYLPPSPHSHPNSVKIMDLAVNQKNGVMEGDCICNWIDLGSNHSLSKTTDR